MSNSKKLVTGKVPRDPNTIGWSRERPDPGSLLPPGVKPKHAKEEPTAPPDKTSEKDEKKAQK